MKTAIIEAIGAIDMPSGVDREVALWRAGRSLRAALEQSFEPVPVKPDVPAEILEREATRRERPAYLRSVPGVVVLGRAE